MLYPRVLYTLCGADCSTDETTPVVNSSESDTVRTDHGLNRSLADDVIESRDLVTSGDVSGSSLSEVQLLSVVSPVDRVRLNADELARRRDARVSELTA